MLVVSGLNIRFSRYERGLRRRYLQVITDLDLEVKAGEVVAVVGASGSGKVCWPMPSWVFCQRTLPCAVLSYFRGSP